MPWSNLIFDPVFKVKQDCNNPCFSLTFGSHMLEVIASSLTYIVQWGCTITISLRSHGTLSYEAPNRTW